MKITLFVLCLFSGIGFSKPKAQTRAPKKVNVEKNATTYTVEEGDWLSSIAEGYSGDQKDWSKIAKKNPEIKNPNLIYPGDVITLAHSGSQKAKSKNSKSEIDKAALGEEEARTPATISQEIPTLVPFDKQQKAQPQEVEQEQQMISEAQTQIRVRVKHFILGQEEVLGEVSGSTEERKFFIPGDVVFVKSLDLSKYKVGSKVSVAKNAGDLEDRTVSKSLKLGELMELVGELEVLEWGEKFVKCEVHAAFGKIERGDKIVPLIPSVRLGQKIKPPTDLLLKVVMAEDMGAKLASQGALILLNKGWQQSVAPDQYYRVFSDFDPVHDTYKKVDPQSKGEVQIVYAGKTASIGLIMKAQRPIQVGDALVPYQHFSEPKPQPHKEIETIEIN